MTAQKIAEIVASYRQRLKTEGVPKVRFAPERKFSTATVAELLSHAHYLLDNAEASRIQGKEGKPGRRLAAAQMCLSFAGWFTLSDLLAHNWSKEPKGSPEIAS